MQQESLKNKTIKGKKLKVEIARKQYGISLDVVRTEKRIPMFVPLKRIDYRDYAN